MGFPLSYLESITKNINEENKKSTFEESMVIELSDGSLVTLGELMKFWITGHQVISEAKEITDEMLKQNREVKDIERSTEEGKIECNINGKIISIQNQNTGKKSKKSTKKMTTIQK